MRKNVELHYASGVVDSVQALSFELEARGVFAYGGRAWRPLSVAKDIREISWVICEEEPNYEDAGAGVGAVLTRVRIEPGVSPPRGLTEQER